jgi:hypothetical protein
MSRLTTLAALRFGYFERTSAATPETIAVALLVPFDIRYPSRFADFGTGAIIL